MYLIARQVISFPRECWDDWISSTIYLQYIYTSLTRLMKNHHFLSPHRGTSDSLRHLDEFTRPHHMTAWMNLSQDHRGSRVMRSRENVVLRSMMRVEQFALHQNCRKLKPTDFILFWYCYHLLNFDVGFKLWTATITFITPNPTKTQFKSILADNQVTEKHVCHLRQHTAHKHEIGVSWSRNW